MDVDSQYDGLRTYAMRNDVGVPLAEVVAPNKDCNEIDGDLMNGIISLRMRGDVPGRT